MYNVNVSNVLVLFGTQGTFYAFTLHHRRYWDKFRAELIVPTANTIENENSSP